jgi:hypothetical protein
MKVERITIVACCGRTSVMFKLERPIDIKMMTDLVAKGFIEDPKFTKAGILYVYNSDFYLSGAFGLDKLQAKCKFKECDQKLNELEGLLLSLE